MYVHSKFASISTCSALALAMPRLWSEKGRALLMRLLGNMGPVIELGAVVQSETRPFQEA